jgi:hypothetical protein
MYAERHPVATVADEQVVAPTAQAVQVARLLTELEKAWLLVVDRKNPVLQVTEAGNPDVIVPKAT